LLPPFYVYLLVSLAYLVLRDKPIPWGAVGAACAYVVNYYQGLTGAPTHFLSHCWSLAVEEQFYVLWPFVLVYLVRRGVRLENALLAAILFVWALRPLLYLGLHVSDEYVYRALETRADHLAAGCLLAVLLRKPMVIEFFERCGRSWFVAPLLALLLLLSGTLHASSAYKYSVGFAIEPLLMALLIPLVILLAQGPGWAATLINAPIVVLIGEASYGMYLFHPMLMWPVAHGVERLTHSPIVGVLASIVVVALVALVSLRLFENPIRRRFRGR
jgi:peptidoglycan/LPS O-acetylase OafA/YrhL